MFSDASVRFYLRGYGRGLYPNETVTVFVSV